MSSFLHLPVLREKVIELLHPVGNGVYVDATVGLGGHSEEIVRLMGAGGRLIGLDRDEEALKRAGERLRDSRVTVKKGSFSDLEQVLSEEGISEVDGILFDLGVSMMQLKDPERGFSFLSAKRLDMRMDRQQRLSAWDIVNRYPEKKLDRILWEFGEERFSRKIAKAIVGQRDKKTIDTCAELSATVEAVYGTRGKVHPATKTFQALRIEVNHELEQLRDGLHAALRLLARGGRLCVIAYHSLEDRVVKQFIAENARNGVLKMLTKKPLTPAPEERIQNPSSRSAKLRAAEKI